MTDKCQEVLPQDDERRRQKLVEDLGLLLALSWIEIQQSPKSIPKPIVCPQELPPSNVDSIRS